MDAGVENSFIDDSKCSDISGWSSLSKVRRSDECKMTCVGDDKSVEQQVNSSYSKHSSCDGDVVVTSQYNLHDNELCGDDDEGRASSRELMAGNLCDRESSFCDNDELTANKLPQSEVNRSSADSVTVTSCESNHRRSHDQLSVCDCDLLHSTPTVHCNANSAVVAPVSGRCTYIGTPVSCHSPVGDNSSTGTPVSDGSPVSASPVQTAAVDSLSVMTHEPQRSGEQVTTPCSSSRCQPAADTSEVSVCGAESGRDDVIAANSLSSVDVTGTSCHHRPVTDGVCHQLSELMQQQCVIDECSTSGSQRTNYSTTIDKGQECVIDGWECVTSGSQILISSSGDTRQECVVRECDERHECVSEGQECVIDECDEVQECSFEDQECVVDERQECVSDGRECVPTVEADVSDSFDLDAATKDLEQAVSAGMLDYLLESSYEENDEDVVSSEHVCDGLGDWAPASSSSDDDDDDDDDKVIISESTLTDDSSDESNEDVIAELVGEEGVHGDVIDADKSDDSDVWQRHERIRRRLKNTVDHTVDHGIVDSASYSSDDDIDVNDSDGTETNNVIHSDLVFHRSVLSVANGDDGASDINCATCSADDNNVDGSADIDVNVVGVIGAALKPSERDRVPLKRNDYCCTVTDTSAADGAADDSDDDGVAVRHARVRRLLQTATAVGDVADSRTGDANQVTAAVNCQSTDVDNMLSHGERHSTTVDCDGSIANDVAAGFNGSADDSQFSVTKDQLTTTNACEFLSNESLQHVPCHSIGKISSVVSEHSSTHHLSVTFSSESADGLLSPVAEAEDSVLLPSDTSLSHCEKPGAGSTSARVEELLCETSLSLEECGIGCSTSTPSSCSHHSLQTRRVIAWQEGVYNGLCRHSDGSDIRMSLDHCNGHLLAAARNLTGSGKRDGVLEILGIYHVS